MADGPQPHANSPAGHRASLQFGWSRRLPMLLQTEAAECGLACLAMVAGFHGHDVDLAGLRRRFSTSLKGVTLAHVMAMATQLGFTCRPLKLDLDELPQLRTPCVLHWDLNHFVVLKRADKRGIVIHDPARGTRKLIRREVSEHFTGVALELSPAANFKPISERQAISLRALTGKVRGLVPALTQILLLALALEVFALAGPFYLQWVLDQALVSADKNLLMLLGLGFTSVVIFQTLISALRSWIVACFSVSLNIQWVNNLFSHMLNLPLGWYEKRHIGDIVSRFGSVGTIQGTITTQFIGSLLDGMMSAITLAVLFTYSISLSLIVIALFSAYLLLRILFFSPIYRLNEEQIICSAKQQSELLETIRGALPIKLGNKQAERSARYANAMVETTNRSLATTRLGIAFDSLNKMLFGIGHVAIVWLAAIRVLDGSLTSGALIAYISYASQFTSRAGGLVDYAIQLRLLRLHAERIADIALARPEEPVAPWGGTLPDKSLEVCNVSFRYGDNEPWILRHCSFRINSGESVALIGSSGCGKTTMIKIILGLLEPSEGKVTFGGINIRTIGLKKYRELIGAVMQDDQLFAGTIADNISFFDAKAISSRVYAAAKLASIHDDISSMPMGYESLIGDMGSMLSGGQKQRIILARALYRCPQLLILDEATCHLDGDSEREINDTILRLRVTRIHISHSSQTISTAQRQLLCAGGQISEIYNE